MSDLLEATIVDGRVVDVVTRATVPGRSADSRFDVANVSLTVTAGGRFVVWRRYEIQGSAEGVVVFDRQTRQVFLSGALPSGLGISDPTRSRLLVPYQGAIGSVSLASLATLPNSQGLLPRALSQDGNRRYAIRGSNGRELVVLNSTSGQVLRTLTLPGSYTEVLELLVTADETKVWILTTTRVPGSDTTEQAVRAFSITSGTQAPAIPLPGSRSGLDVG